MWEVGVVGFESGASKPGLSEDTRAAENASEHVDENVCTINLSCCDDDDDDDDDDERGPAVKFVHAMNSFSPRSDSWPP